MIQYTWKLTGNQWQITSSKGLSYTIPNHNGMFYLAELLKNTNKEILYSKLISRGLFVKPLPEFQGQYKFELLKYGMHESDWYQEMPVADFETIADVGKAILQVRDKIAVLKENCDYGRVELLEDELSQLIAYLKHAFPKRQILRVFSSDQTKLQRCVKKSLQRAYRLIRVHDTDLAAFFKAHIQICTDYIQMNDAEGVGFQLIKN